MGDLRRDVVGGDDRLVGALLDVHVHLALVDGVEAVVAVDLAADGAAVGGADQHEARQLADDRRRTIGAGDGQLAVERRHATTQHVGGLGRRDARRHERRYHVTDSRLPVGLTHQLGAQLFTSRNRAFCSSSAQRFAESPSPNQKRHFTFWIKFGLSPKFGLGERLRKTNRKSEVTLK